VREYTALLVAAFCLVCTPEVPAVCAQGSEQALEADIISKVHAGQVDAALDEARLALEQYPNSSPLQELLGAAFFKKGLNQDAERAFRRAIELDPSIPQNHYDLALVYLSEKRYAAAVPPLETCLRLNTQNPEAHLLLGRACHNLNRTALAIEEFKKALSLSPQLPLAHYHLGYAFQSQGNLKGALEEFKKELEVNPGFYDAYWLAGNIELNWGNLDAAETLFRKGNSLKPEAFQAHYGLGRVLAGRREWRRAEAELKKALEPNPNHIEIHYALARIYQQMGKKADADQEYRICAALHSREQGKSSGIAGQQR
jgi:tetratricopeptide (TPR) repeat protein